MPPGHGSIKIKISSYGSRFLGPGSRVTVHTFQVLCVTPVSQNLWAAPRVDAKATLLAC